MSLKSEHGSIESGEPGALNVPFVFSLALFSLLVQTLAEQNCSFSPGVELFSIKTRVFASLA